MSELNPKTLTAVEMETQQYNYLDSKPNASVWQDRYPHSSGSIEVELNAVVSAHVMRRVLFERKNVYLRETKNLSSAIAIANILGYSAKRPTNARVRLKVLPNQTRTIAKFEEVGLLKDVSLLAVDTTNLTSGVLTYIDCIIGNKLTTSLTTPDNKLHIFRFIDQNVSSDIRLFLNNNVITKEIDFSEQILEMENDKFFVITNPFTSIDLMYLNNLTGNFYYDTGYTISLEYIEANNLDYLLNAAQVSFFYGTFYPEGTSPTTNDTQTLSKYQAMENLDSIVINAPLYFETQSKIRGREDFRKNFLLLGGGSFYDTNGHDLSPAEIELTYLKTDLTLLTQTEKNNYLAKLNGQTNYGVYTKSIKDPIQVNYLFSLKLKQYPSADISEVLTNISEIFAYEHLNNLPPISDNRVNRRENKLQNIINLDQVEHELTRIQNSKTLVNPVQIARIDLVVGARLNNTLYNRGEFIKLNPNDNVIYECVKAGTSANTQPTFSNTIDTLTIEGINTWQPLTSYSLGDFVTATYNTPYVFKCVQAGVSGQFQPSWNLSNAENIQTPDNTVQWQAFLPLDVDNFLIWRARPINLRSLDIGWNEYAKLSYGANVIWL